VEGRSYFTGGEGNLAYHYNRNSSKHQETNPQKAFKSKHRTTDFFQSESFTTDYGTRTYKALLSFDMRSIVKKRNADRKAHKKITETGYKLLIGTMEQNLYIKGPSQGVWNRVESL
jgi:hypothetical protein